MHGHEPFITLPAWVELLPVVFIAYMAIAMVCGCPYCMYPDMAWPVTLTKRLIASKTNLGEVDE